MYHFIVNPNSRSGRGKKYWKKIHPVLESLGVAYDVRFSERVGHISELVAEVQKKYGGGQEAPHLVILGGDGTVNEALQGIRDFDRVIFSYIPTGSSNDLARALGISRDPREALARILDQPEERRMDMGVVQYSNAWYYGKEIQVPDRRFLCSCGIGFDAAVCAETFRSKVKDFFNRCGLGKLTYLGIALKQLIRLKFVDGEIVADRKERIPLKKIVFISSMVHKYAGGGFQFCPDARDDDRLLDICVASNAPKLRILRILPTAFSGNHVRFKEIRQLRVREITIRTKAPQWVQTDGEVKAETSEIRVFTHPQQIRFVY